MTLLNSGSIFSGTIKSKLESPLADPPLLPNKEILFKPSFFEVFKTLIIFFEFPDVDNAINKSPFLCNASRFLENIFSNPISFPQAVNVEVSCAKVITG